MWWPNKFSTHLIRHIDLIIFIAGLRSQLFKIHRDGFSGQADPAIRLRIDFIYRFWSPKHAVLFWGKEFFWPRQAPQTLLLGVGWIGRKWAFHNQNSNASTGQRKFVRFLGGQICFLNLYQFKTNKKWCDLLMELFCKSCVHIYFWLVLGKKYHRVFIKQSHLTFDNVTDQVKLIEARL